jgi:RecJ-like exonuclease
MNTRVNDAIHSLRCVLSDVKFPENPVVENAFKIIEAFCDKLCPKCEGQGQVRVWHYPDELGPPEKCPKCGGTGRVTSKTGDQAMVDRIRAAGRARCATCPHHRHERCHWGSDTGNENWPDGYKHGDPKPPCMC